MSQNQGWAPPPEGQQPTEPPPAAPPPPGSRPPPGSPPPAGAPPPHWAPPPPPNQSGHQQFKYCVACNSLIDNRSVDCPRCGVRQPDAVYSEPKNRPLAIVLALLLGGFGIHRFYVGPIAWGVVYLIFFWTGIPGFLAWLEAIYWLTRSDVEWAQKYGGTVQKSNGVAIGCLWIVALLPLIALVLGGALLVGGLVASV